MARLFLPGNDGPFVRRRFVAALAERLSPQYNVYRAPSQYGDYPKIQKDALLAIAVSFYDRSDGIEIVTHYEPGSVFLMFTIVPILFAFFRWRSRERYALEGEVVKAIRDVWPEAIEKD
jgi:hypothetical protein